MPRKLFITGAGGYLGGYLLTRLARESIQIRVLSRNAVPQAGDSVDPVRGDLRHPEAWSSALAGCDTVLHLAAATGKASQSEHQAVNLEGTQLLLKACEAADVKRFIHVSSIAAGFKDQTGYPYARSKAAAEVAVAASDLDTVIVRPTIIIGPGAPVLEGLAKLVRAPIMPVFGSGAVRVQPIFATDLSELLTRLVCEGGATGQTIEVGGADVLTIEEFLQRIRIHVVGRRAAVIHVPLTPVRATLLALEPLFRRWLPLTAGQLATFANDGVANPDAAAAFVPDRLGIDASLSECFPRA